MKPKRWRSLTMPPFIFLIFSKIISFWSVFISRWSKTPLKQVTIALSLPLINKYRETMISRAGKYVEVVFWVLALTLLATANPHEHHFTLCPLANLGFDWCPGCGLGRSITAIFHADFGASFRQHWFGLPALLIILYRIFQLCKQLIIKQKNYFNYKEV